MVIADGWNRALSALYGSILDPDRAGACLAEIAALTGSSAAGIGGHDLEHGRGRIELLHGMDGFDIGRYLSDYARDNPWLSRCGHAYRAGALVDSDDHVARDEFRATALYRDLLKAHDGIDNAILLCAHRDGDDLVLMGFSRPGRVPPCTPAQRQVLVELGPHWCNAYTLQRRLSWLEEQATSLDNALDHLTTAMVLFDASGRIAKLNEAAARLLQDGSLVHGKAGVLSARRSPQQLARAIAGACHGRDGRQPGRRERFRSRVLLRDGNGQALAVADIQPLPLSFEGGEGYAAVLYVQQLGAPAATGGVHALQRLFALTDAEARLALALREHGQLVAAASALGITQGSARTRLKLVFDKVGEHSQAALLRVLDAALSG